MANAIKKISVQRGYDVTEYLLNVFGGAGGQHACAVADALGMSQVLIHPLAGVLSAYGIGLADIVAMREQAVEAPLTEALIAALPQILQPLEHDARADVEAEDVPADRITANRRAHLRYDGTDTAVIVPVGSLAEMTTAFEAEYARRFSFLMPGKTIIAEAVSVEVTGAQESLPADTTIRSAENSADPGGGPPAGAPSRCRSACSPRVPGPRWTCSPAPPCAAGRPWTAPPSSPRISPPPCSSPAGGPW